MKKMQLLFCNTFSYDSQRPNGNWAVVKFPRMIAVEEVRIIGPGVKAHPQLHDNQFTGKTSPNKFQVQFFSDDRSASMTTYEHVGSLEYVEGSPNRFKPSAPLYSEKLLLNGYFNYITIAVYGGTLTDVGAGTPSLGLNAKTPSLIIHEKPEGRSVYISGVQDIPQLTKDLDKPEPLMSSFPSTNRNYPTHDETVGRRDIGYGNNDNLNSSDSHLYYDRRHGRNRSFETDGSRIAQKNYMGERVEYSQRMGIRKTLLPNVDPNTAAFRTDNDRLSYKEKNRPVTSSQGRSLGRQENDNPESLQKEKNRHQSSDNAKRQDARTPMGLQGEVKDLRQTLEQNKAESATEHGKERTQDWMEGEYEEISDEETEEERFAAIHDMEEILDDDAASPSMCFNPFLMEPVQLMHFSHPALTEFEISCSNLIANQDDPQLSENGNEEDLERFELLLTKAKKIGRLENVSLTMSPDEGKDWVAVSEEIIPLIANVLPSYAVNSREKYDEYLSLMVTWTFTGLDFNVGSKQAIGTNLRMLKCGINLAHKLCLMTQDVVAFLTELKLDEQLIELLHMENMASSVKIMIIHALDAYLSWPSSVASYFDTDGESADNNYARLVQLVLKPQASRVATALSRLMNKLSVFHAMWKLKNIVKALVSEKIPKLSDPYDSEEEFTGEVPNAELVEDAVLEEEEEMVVMSSTSNDEEEEDDRNVETFRKIQMKGEKADKTAVPHMADLVVESATMLSSHLSENATVPLDSVMSISDIKMTRKDLDEVMECVGLIIHALENVKTTIAQLPKRSFPTSTDLGGISDKSAKQCLFRMLEFYETLSSIQALLCSPVISSNKDIFEIVYNLLDFLMSCQEGLLFLSSNSSCMNCVTKHLLSSSSNLSASEIETLGTAPHLGAKLAFHIQCIQCLDHLQILHDADSTEADASEEVVEVLKVLYSLTFPTFGKCWISAILSLEDNILPLLAYVQQVKMEDIIDRADECKTIDDENSSKKDDKGESMNKKKTVRKTAPGGFAVGILLITLKMSQNMSYLIRHRQTILHTMKGAPMGRYIEEVHEWLRSVESLPKDGEIIAPVMEFLKTGFVKLEWNTLMTSGPGLCTALRILRHLTSSGGIHASKCGTFTDCDMGNRRDVLQVFAGGGLTVLMDGIERLNKCFEYPCYSQHALTTLLSFNFHNLVTGLSENLLTLTGYLLNVLLSTEDGKFQPEHLTKLLIPHYTGMYTILRESSVEKLDNITEKIISIFGIFVNKSIKASSENSAEEGYVSQILGELVSNMQEKCQTMVPASILLSHLLPIPLPLSLEGEALDEDGEKAIVAYRQSWEQLINSVLDQLLSFISVACHSLCVPLLEVLVPLLQQIIDLSPTLAIKVTQSVLSACAIPNEIKDAALAQGETETAKVEVTYSFKPHPIIVLSEIAKLPSARAAVLHCMEEDKNCLNSLWKVVNEKTENGSELLLNAAIKLANVLLDADNSLVRHDSYQIIFKTFSESCLNEILTSTCDGLKSPVMMTVHDSLSCLKSLMANEHCFKMLKNLIGKDSFLFSAVNSILKLWVGDTAAVAALLMSFSSLVSQVGAPQEGRPTYLTKSEIRTALKWTKDTPEKDHPIVKLKSKLEEMDLDEGWYSELLNEVASLCQSLKTPYEFKHKKPKERKSKDGAIPLSLIEQYKKRPVWVHGDSDTSFSVRWAILKGNIERSFFTDNINPKDRVKANLTEMAEKSCPGVDLEKCFKELTESAKTTDIDKIRMEAKAKRLKKLETFSTRHGKTMTYIKRSHGLVNPSTRARGRGRGAASGRHYDLFRQRKQNTSRPPSMHVDDFIAADEEDSNPAASSFVSPATPSFVPSRRATLPFKREFIPRGRGNRGMGRGSIGNRGGFSNFIGTGANTEPLSGLDKFRTRTIGNRPQDRFPRIRGRGRDPTRSFSPRDGFKPKPPSWSFSSPRGFHATGGFRGARGVKSLMRIGRPLFPPPPLSLTTKWGGMPPPPRRGRGYGKPRGKHIRSFTR